MTRPLGGVAMNRRFPHQKHNTLLADLPVSEWAMLEPHLQQTTLTAEATLYRAHKCIEHAYFPLSGSVSLLTEFADGFSVETAEVGSEGMVGVQIVLGDTSSPTAAKVLVPGIALHITARALMAQLDQLPTLGRKLLRQASAQIACAMQLVACNAHHHLDARLARCLLNLHDRTGKQAIPVTHEGLATLLCAHRPSVSVSMKRLEKRGLIIQGMGFLTVADPEGLNGVSCECYSIMRALRNTSKLQSF